MCSRGRWPRNHGLGHLRGRGWPPRWSSGVPAGSCRPGRARAATPWKPDGPAAPAMARLCPQTAPTRPAPTCGLTAHGRAGRILPGGAPGSRASYGRYWTPGNRPPSLFSLVRPCVCCLGNLAPLAATITGVSKPRVAAGPARTGRPHLANALRPYLRHRTRRVPGLTGTQATQCATKTAGRPPPSSSPGHAVAGSNARSAGYSASTSRRLVLVSSTSSSPPPDRMVLVAYRVKPLIWP